MSSPTAPSPPTAASPPYGGPESITYGALDTRARAAAAFLGATVPPGSRVLLAYAPGSGADLAGALFGCWYAGMTAVPLPVDMLASGERLRDAFRSLAPEAALAAPSLAAVIRRREHGGTVTAAADGRAVDGEPIGRLARRWRPVGVLPGADAYLGHVSAGWCEAAFTHADVLRSLAMLSATARQGLDHGQLGWLAQVHGLELAWQALLPVYDGGGGAGAVRHRHP